MLSLLNLLYIGFHGQLKIIPWVGTVLCHTSDRYPPSLDKLRLDHPTLGCLNVRDTKKNWNSHQAVNNSWKFSLRNYWTENLFEILNDYKLISHLRSKVLNLGSQNINPLPIADKDQASVDPHGHALAWLCEAIHQLFVSWVDSFWLQPGNQFNLASRIFSSSSGCCSIHSITWPHGTSGNVDLTPSHSYPGYPWFRSAWNGTAK